MRRVDIDRAEIEALTSAYLAAGGEIQHVPYLVRAEEKIQLKRHKSSKERAVYVSGSKGEFE